MTRIEELLQNAKQLVQFLIARGRREIYQLVEEYALQTWEQEHPGKSRSHAPLVRVAAWLNVSEQQARKYRLGRDVMGDEVTRRAIELLSTEEALAVLSPSRVAETITGALLEGFMRFFAGDRNVAIQFVEYPSPSDFSPLPGCYHYALLIALTDEQLDPERCLELAPCGHHQGHYFIYRTWVPAEVVVDKACLPQRFSRDDLERYVRSHFPEKVRERLMPFLLENILEEIKGKYFNELVATILYWIGLLKIIFEECFRLSIEARELPKEAIYEIGGNLFLLPFYGRDKNKRFPSKNIALDEIRGIIGNILRKYQGERGADG